MGRPPKFHLRKRDAEAIAKFALPNVLLVLARDKILKEEHTKDPATILRLVMQHKREAIRKMKICWTIEQEFLDEAIKFWKKKKRKIAIVLYASAIEQLVNYMYQLILEANNMDGLLPLRRSHG